MKKLLTIAAVLLTAALVFTGCSNPASGGGEGGPSLPGNWKTTANYFDANTQSVFETGSITFDGKGGAIYNNAAPKETKTGEDELKVNEFRFDSYKLVRDLDFTGFEGTASCTSTYSTYGYRFNVSSDWKNLYEIIIQGQQALIRKRINGTTTKLTDWETYSCIKAEPSENTFTVYKDGSSIVIQINGTTIYTISNPEITNGGIACTCGISYDDILHQTNIKTTYKLSKFQY